MAQESRSLKPLAGALGTALLLGACTIMPGPYRPSTRPAPLATPAAPTSTAPPASAAQPERPGPPAREIHLSPATRSLVTRAHAQAARGDLPAASSTLDRALRIEPYNPLLWIELGRLRLAESDAHQAEGCARKALALASGNRAAQALSGRLLVDALRAERRNQEAREVENQPYMH